VCPRSPANSVTRVLRLGVRPENSVRGLQGERRVSVTVIFGSRLTDFGARAVLSGWKAAIVAAQSGADKRRKCL